MNTVTQPKKSSNASSKVSRSVRLVHPLDGDGKNAELLITMTTARKTMPAKVETFTYFVDRLPSEIGGEGYLFEKCGDGVSLNEEYHVLLSPEGHSCECKGFLRWDHCKHVESLLALKARGKL